MTVEPVKPRFRILSIDGGGIKGAYAASVLAELEKTTGQRCVDHFDLIAGTSTGGIIAIGLALGHSAEDILRFYTEHGPTIFPRSGILSGRLRTIRQLVRPKHDAGKLRSTLETILGDAKFGDAACRLVIPAYDITEGRAFIFKTLHHPHLAHDADIPAVDVAMATAAAPTYFRSNTITQHGGTAYIDGGLWANCPVHVAVTEATHFLSEPPSNIDILSIGTTTTPFNPKKQWRRGGLAQWTPALVQILMAGQAEAALNHAQLLTGNSVHRINHQTAVGRFGLDKIEGLNDLVALGRHDALKREHKEATASRFLNGQYVDTFVP